MKHVLTLAAVLCASAAQAQEEPRHEGYAPLENLVGSWTIAGKEHTYLETCEWYQGKRHIICNTESRRTDGSKSHGMSILSFIPGQGYVYTGIGSRGRYETYRGGTYTEGVIEYLDQSAEGRTRIRIGPFNDKTSVPFNIHTSKDGVTWDAADSFNYIRVTSSTPAPITVREHLLTSMADTNGSINQACAKQHPQLKDAIDAATANYQLRFAAILDALLETEDFKSLSQAEAPAAAIASSAQNAAFMANVTVAITLEDCNRILADMNGTSDEAIKGVTMQVLAAMKGMMRR